MKIEEGYLYIAKPLLIIAASLALFGSGAMVGATFFQVTEKEACLVRQQQSP